MFWLAALCLVGCENVIVLTSDTIPCTDYDFNDPGASQVDVDVSGVDVRIYRTNVLIGCDDIFDPEVEADGHNIMVWEFWEQRTVDDCTTCLEPSVVMEEPPSGTYHLVWYNGDSNQEYGARDIVVE